MRPVRYLLQQGRRVAPLRLYGEDAELRKDKACLVFTWSGSSRKHLPTSKSRFVLISAYPIKADDENARGLAEMHRVPAWSFEAPLREKCPPADHNCDPLSSGLLASQKGLEALGQSAQVPSDFSSRVLGQLAVAQRNIEAQALLPLHDPKVCIRFRGGRTVAADDPQQR